MKSGCPQLPYDGILIGPDGKVVANHWKTNNTRGFRPGWDIFTTSIYDVLVPPPRMHLTRYHGVFAPHSQLRAAVTPAGRGKGRKQQAEAGAEPSSTPRHMAMSWAKRLKRVFGIDIEACARCGGKLKVIASIEEPAVIAKILAHLEHTAPEQHQPKLPLGARAPPVRSRLL